MIFPTKNRMNGAIACLVDEKKMLIAATDWIWTSPYFWEEIGVFLFCAAWMSGRSASAAIPSVPPEKPSR